MSAVGNFQVYANRQLPEPEQEDSTPAPTQEVQVDTQVLHDDELWVTYRHGCG